MSVRINGFPCDVCGASVRHLPNCTYGKTKIGEGSKMFERSQFLDLLERVRDLCHQNAKDKGFWDEGEKSFQSLGSIGGTSDIVRVKTKPWNFGEKIALIHSELSEMLEAWRKDIRESDKDIRVIDPAHRTPDDPIGTRRITAIEEEVADVFIRLMDLCGKLDIDVGRVILAKMEYNKKRDHMHGGRKC